VCVCVCGLFCGAHHTQITHSPPAWIIAATQCFPNTPMTRIDSLAEQFKALAQSANRKRARARTSQLSGMPWLLRLRLTSVRGHSGTQPRTAASSALLSPTSSDPSPPHRHSRPFPHFRARPLAPSLRLPDVLRSIRRPSVCRSPFHCSADLSATKHHTPRLAASRRRSAYALACLVVAVVRKAMAKSIRRGAEHATSPPSPLRVARVRLLRAHGRVLAMEYTS